MKGNPLGRGLCVAADECACGRARPGRLPRTLTATGSARALLALADAVGAGSHSGGKGYCAGVGGAL
jgi:hypothetical protein